jgi:hypothetical protein
MLSKLALDSEVLEETRWDGRKAVAISACAAIDNQGLSQAVDVFTLAVSCEVWE